MGDDYFEMSKEDFRITFCDSEISIPNNVKTLKLFTESGY